MKNIVLLFLFLFISCAKQKEEEKTALDPINNTIPPQGFVLSNNTAVLNIGEAMTPITASYFGTIGEFRISTELPRGLVFNTTNGTISGTPSKSIPLSSFIITIYNPAGYQTQELQLIVNEPTPTNLKYSSNLISLVRGSTSVYLSPTNDGGKISSYSINPQPPSGINFNTENGLISGVSNENLSKKTFTVTGINPNGSASYQMDIEVKGYPPTNLTYNIIQEYKNGDVISVMPSYSGDIVSNFTISNNLPLGLNFDQNTGHIYGRFLNNTDENFTITATNDFGFTSFSFNLKAITNISKVSLTNVNTCLLKDSNLMCAGLNQLIQSSNSEECLDNRCVSSFVQLKDNFGNEIKAFDFALTSNNLCYIDNQQNVLCRGNNSKGQLGNTTVSDSDAFLPVKNESNENLKGYKIINGLDFFCTLDFSRNVYCWGDNLYNQIKDSGLFISLAYKLEFSNIKNVFAGKNNLCLSQAFLHCRGSNNHQQLSSPSSNGWIIAETQTGRLSNVSDVLIGDKLLNIKSNGLWFSSGLDIQGNSGVVDSEGMTLSKYTLSSHTDFSLMNKSYFINNQFFIFDFNDSSRGGFDSFSEVSFSGTFAINSYYDSNKCFKNDNELFCFGANSHGSVGNGSYIPLDSLQKIELQ